MMQQVMITGARGFLGLSLVRLLRQHNIAVNALVRGPHPELSRLGVNVIIGNLADKVAISTAMENCDTVFHVASKAGVWGDEQEYIDTNVTGNQNIIDACQSLGIKHLVYTSTPSVIFSGKDEDGVDESTPYCSHPLNAYTRTKIIAERAVLAANSPQLKTCAIRPHLIWGPGDPHLIPRVIAKAKAGKLALVGKEDKLVDTVYVENAALAHFLAAQELHQDGKCAGKAYFISNDEPITMAAMLNHILAAAQLPAVSKRVPASLAYGIGAALETVYRFASLQQEPAMTRFVAKQLSTSHWFDISAAKRDFGYHAPITIAQGMAQLKQSFNQS
ncbi:NAD-dependent epimerase/dehydratase family protein [Motilimonas pumila]|uniref:NAD-dependent epimerase/dehydratase family protein n=1 Tax=Motilimonas pumila TaxID=2303987 RepID=A0A418YB11_9GAMM|nr:NAD-dependent epimerase/dehydratase family protein [Motilimonas pumila]RJG40158.1 NAD-dependent epimerase/dehydratase family protein [Motilimonas pumila]